MEIKKLCVAGGGRMGRQIAMCTAIYGVETTVYDVMEPVLLALCFLMITAYLVDGSFNPFLYFRF